MNVRKLAAKVRRTPLHPQWLLGGEAIAGGWVRDQAHGRVLDVGCASRWIERWLEPGCSYVGLDYPATGRDLYRARPDLFADASELPLQDATFDTVVLLEVLEHLRRPCEALREAARVVRPQGTVLLSLPFLYPVHDAPHDYQRLTIHGLIRDVEAAGLRVERVTPTLGSADTAGLMTSLALGGAVAKIIEQGDLRLVLLPLLALAIPLVNCTAWIAARVLPSWDAMTAGYRLSATRP
ncbi:class I SAM-dependent methyltransferase [Dokdonella sp.]|uniref:class I SAM-dependent methyltransferase n=1 Tax=Dokdonella sp. TaxID=2291710 RepID=UPI0037832451